jgi:SET and MYND domain-containing protein
MVPRTEYEESILQASAGLVANLLLRIGVSRSQSACASVLSRLECNVFTITDAELNPVGVGLFEVCSLINHSCEPSCTAKFNELGQLSILTTRKLVLGDEISISYVDTSKSSWCRQRELLKRYGFFCQCHRCASVDVFDCIICTRCESTLPAGVRLASSCSRDMLTTFVSTDSSAFECSTAKAFVSFLEEISYPVGIAFFPYLKSNAFLEFLKSNDSDCDFSHLNIEAGLGVNVQLLECSNCAASLPISHAFKTVRKVFQLWTKYKDVSSHDATHALSAPIVSKLMADVSRVDTLQLILAVIMDISPRHYCVVQLADLLANDLLAAISKYEELLELSPNNKKLKKDLSSYMEKYVKYADLRKELLEKLLPRHSW